MEKIATNKEKHQKCKVLEQPPDLMEKNTVLFTDRIEPEILFDKEPQEITIKTTEPYTLDGLEDLGTGISPGKLAISALLLMVRGIVHNWKQPLAYYLVNESCDSLKLKDIINEALGHLKSMGLEFNKKVSKWKNVRDFFAEDQQQAIRIAPKLTPKHLNPNGFAKMEVKLASQSSAKEGLNDAIIYDNNYDDDRMSDLEGDLSMLWMILFWNVKVIQMIVDFTKA
eukprot:gene10015-18644_t